MRLNPSHLFIDACSMCQLRCIECPATKMGYKFNVGRGYLTFENFKNLIDLNPQIKWIEFNNYGELFINPELESLIKYAYDKKIIVSCSGVNLNSVKPELLESLVKYRFKVLTCSIDGTNQDTYELYRKGGDFDKVINNIKLINYYKEQYHSKYPILNWQFIVFGHNEHELPLAREMAHNLNMKFYPKTNWNSEYSPIRDREYVRSETGWSTVTREEYKEIFGNNLARDTCLSLWNSPRISWDGKITGCCWNVWSEFGGNVFTEGYVNCINSEKINYAKKMLLGSVKPRPDIPCTSCEIFKDIVNTNTYFTLKEIVQYESRLFYYLKKIRDFLSHNKWRMHL
jgi:MoaA/NifB/PqqE/SkfB family radical SAM enzyme